MYVFPAKRQRENGEVVPSGVQHSRTFQGDEQWFAAANAVDLVWDTRSRTESASDKTRAWLEVTLPDLHCVQSVVEFNSKGSRERTWTCCSTNCNRCVGELCDTYPLTVSTDTSTSSLPLLPDCRWGDTVRVQRAELGSLSIYELAVIGKSGEIRYWYVTARYFVSVLLCSCGVQ